MSFYYGEHSSEVNQAKKVFDTFAKGSNGLTTHQFRTMFYATGEELSENEINDLFGEVDDDRDGTISLEEFTNWFKKDDSYEYNIRTRPLRDVKERLKTPAFFNAIQYLMQKNSNGSSLEENGKKLLDIAVKVKIGSMEHQKPAFGVDIRHETYPDDGANPAMIAEFIWDESREIIDAENNMRKIVQNFNVNHGKPTVFEPIQVDGRPGGRITMDGASDIREPLRMVTAFMANLEEFHAWVHLSHKLEEMDGASMAIDAGLLFKGNRAFFNMLPLEQSASLMPRPLYQALSVMDHVRLNVVADCLGEVGADLPPPTGVILRKKNEMAQVVNYGSLSADFHDFFPMGVEWLKTIKAFGHCIVATGIDVDVSFIFNQPFDQNAMNAFYGQVSSYENSQAPFI